MKILVVGSGGREHAIVWRLKQDAEQHEIYCAPGNAGTGAIAENINIKAEEIDLIVAWAMKEKPDLVVVGPEAPLVAGLVDRLESIGITAFGPCQAGAQMEGSKKFAKEVMAAAGVPTAKAALASFGLPVVIKADGLAAGKGVVVAETTKEAEKAIDAMLTKGLFGKAGAEVLVEQFLKGEECSILALVDGEKAVLLPSSQDHKRAFDGDKGPNTGGMGAYSPAPVVKDAMLPRIRDEIILPVVRELRKRGIRYRGILYAGLMIDGEDINVVEFNARFGDPETEAVLPRLGGDFGTVLMHTATGSLEDEDVVVKGESAATVIIAAKGYPGSYEKDIPITGFAGNPALVFHCGTKRDCDYVISSGGRILSVTGLGATLREAVDQAYGGVRKIHAEGTFYRTDIAHRAL